MVKFLIDSDRVVQEPSYGLTLHDSISTKPGWSIFRFTLWFCRQCSKTNQVLTAKEGEIQKKENGTSFWITLAFKPLPKQTGQSKFTPIFMPIATAIQKRLHLVHQIWAPQTIPSPHDKIKPFRASTFDYEFIDAKPPHKPQPQLKEYVAAARQYYDEVETDSVRATAGHRAIDYIEKFIPHRLTTRPLKLNIPIYYDSDGQPMTFLDAFKINWRNSICQFEQALPPAKARLGPVEPPNGHPSSKLVSSFWMVQQALCRSQNQPLSINKLLRIIKANNHQRSGNRRRRQRWRTDGGGCWTDRDYPRREPKRSAEENEPVEKKKKKRSWESTVKKVKSSEFVDADE